MKDDKRLAASYARQREHCARVITPFVPTPYYIGFDHPATAGSPAVWFAMNVEREQWYEQRARRLRVESYPAGTFIAQRRRWYTPVREEVLLWDCELLACVLLAANALPHRTHLDMACEDSI